MEVDMNDNRKAKFEDFAKGNITLMETLGVDKPQMTALFQSGFRLFEQGRYKDARRIFQGLAILDGTNPFVYEILGAIFQKEGKPEVAIACYNKAIELFPRNTYCLTNRGEILLRLGLFDDAAQDLKEAIELDPEMKDPAANRARLLVLSVQQAANGVEEVSK
jgi:tetratricopeptide (TPR) repeat protein